MQRASLLFTHNGSVLPLTCQSSIFTMGHIQWTLYSILVRMFRMWFETTFVACRIWSQVLPYPQPVTQPLHRLLPTPPTFTPHGLCNGPELPGAISAGSVMREKGPPSAVYAPIVLFKRENNRTKGPCVMGVKMKGLEKWSREGTYTYFRACYFDIFQWRIWGNKSGFSEVRWDKRHFCILKPLMSA